MLLADGCYQCRPGCLLHQNEKHSQNAAGRNHRPRPARGEAASAERCGRWGTGIRPDRGRLEGMGDVEIDSEQNTVYREVSNCMMSKKWRGGAQFIVENMTTFMRKSQTIETRHYMRQAHEKECLSLSLVKSASHVIRAVYGPISGSKSPACWKGLKTAPRLHTVRLPAYHIGIAAMVTSLH